MDSKLRNKLIGHLAHLDPPIRDAPAVLAKINAVLGSDGPVEAPAKLTVEQGDKLIKTLGIK